MKPEVGKFIDSDGAGLASADEYTAAARMYLRRRDLRAAVRQLAGAVARDPSHAASKILLVEVISASKDPEILLRLSGDVFFGLAALRALHCARTSRRSEALELLGRLVRFRPEKEFVEWACEWEEFEASAPETLAEFVHVSVEACLASAGQGALSNLRSVSRLLTIARQRSPEHVALLLAEVSFLLAVDAPERVLELASGYTGEVTQAVARGFAEAAFRSGDEAGERLWLARQQRTDAINVRLAELALARGDAETLQGELAHMAASPRRDWLGICAHAFHEENAAWKLVSLCLSSLCRGTRSAAVEGVERLSASRAERASRLRVIADRRASTAELAVARALSVELAPGLVLEWEFDGERTEFPLAEFEVPRDCQAARHVEASVLEVSRQPFDWDEWTCKLRESCNDAATLEERPFVIALDPDREQSLVSQALSQFVAWGIQRAVVLEDPQRALEDVGSWLADSDPFVASAGVAGLSVLSEDSRDDVRYHVLDRLERFQEPLPAEGAGALAGLALAVGVGEEHHALLRRLLLEAGPLL